MPRYIKVVANLKFMSSLKRGATSTGSYQERAALILTKFKSKCTKSTTRNIGHCWKHWTPTSGVIRFLSADKMKC